METNHNFTWCFNGCETSSYISRVFQNGVMRRIFGHKKKDVTGRLTKPHNEELVICTPYLYY
jgi:hypothetical protein